MKYLNKFENRKKIGDYVTLPNSVRIYLKELKYKEGDFVRFVSIEGLFIIVIVDADSGTDFNYRIENVKNKDRYWVKEEQIFPVKKSDADVAMYKYNL